MARLAALVPRPRANLTRFHGDAVDVAFLVMAHKAGVVKAEMANTYPEIDTIPYESDRLFSASITTTLARAAGPGTILVDCNGTL